MARGLTCGDVDRSYISRLNPLSILSSRTGYVREQIRKLLDLRKSTQEVSDYPPGNQLPDRQGPIGVRLDMNRDLLFETYGNSKSHFREMWVSVIRIALRWRGWLRDARSQALHVVAAPAGSGSASDASATWHFSTLQAPPANRNFKFLTFEGLGVDGSVRRTLHAPCGCCTYRSRGVIHLRELDPTRVSRPMGRGRATRGSRPALVCACTQAELYVRRVVRSYLVHSARDRTSAKVLPEKAVCRIKQLFLKISESGRLGSSGQALLTCLGQPPRRLTCITLLS